MIENSNRTKLKLVGGRKHKSSVEAERFRTVDIGAQASLFPKPKPGVVLFVAFPEVMEREFVDLIEHAKPGYVFDLRLAPRFDVGQLNRKRAFQLFQSAHSRYIDLTMSMTAASSREEVRSQVREIFVSTSFNLSRPVMFLLGHSANSIATDAEILAVLADAGKNATEVVQVPR